MFGTGSDTATAPRDLWLDRFAAQLGFGLVADRLPWDLPPSYVYAAVTVVVFTVGLNAWKIARGVPVIYRENPYFVLQPLVLLLGAYGARSLSAEYGRVVEAMAVRDRLDDPEPVVDVVPSWLPPALFLAAAGVQLLRGVVGPGWDNLPGTIANLVVFPFVYAPIVAQFLAIYVAIEVVAPVRIARSDLGIHFLDPQGVGGLRPLGELVKRAYYFVVVALITYALITYAPFIESAWTTTTYANIVFTAVWLATVATVAFAVLTLHRFMRREKRAEIQRLETRLRKHIENPWDVSSYEVPADHKSDVEDIRRRIDRVNNTREYPATFSIWTQLLLSLVTPKALQLVLGAM